VDWGSCSTEINHKKIPIRERGSSQITFDNENSITVTRIQVDGCLELDGFRCDWLLIIDQGTEIYIELKGCDVEHAFKQIENTIKIISQDKRSVSKYCYVITTRTPLTSPQIQVKAKYFKKQYNAVLRVKKTGCTENINSLLS
jgi:hypothetical protein